MPTKGAVAGCNPLTGRDFYSYGQQVHVLHGRTLGAKVYAPVLNRVQVGRSLRTRSQLSGSGAARPASLQIGPNPSSSPAHQKAAEPVGSKGGRFHIHRTRSLALAADSRLYLAHARTAHRRLPLCTRHIVSISSTALCRSSFSFASSAFCSFMPGSPGPFTPSRFSVPAQGLSSV